MRIIDVAKLILLYHWLATDHGVGSETTTSIHNAGDCDFGNAAFTLYAGTALQSEDRSRARGAECISSPKPMGSRASKSIPAMNTAGCQSARRWVGSGRRCGEPCHLFRLLEAFVKAWDPEDITGLASGRISAKRCPTTYQNIFPNRDSSTWSFCFWQPVTSNSVPSTGTVISHGRRCRAAAHRSEKGARTPLPPTNAASTPTSDRVPMGYTRRQEGILLLHR